MSDEQAEKEDAEHVIASVQAAGTITPEEADELRRKNGLDLA